MSNEIEVRPIVHGSADYQLETKLRYKVLREALGLNYTDEELALEVHDLHLGAFKGPTLLGCLFLRRKDPVTMVMRQVAVAEEAQGQGVGRKLVVASEVAARREGCTEMILNARETAIAFYLALGYETFGEMHIAVGIPHCMMRKRL